MGAAQTAEFPVSSPAWHPGGFPRWKTNHRMEPALLFFALLFKFYHLLGQILIALGHLAIRVMGKNAFALGADLLCPDRMGNLGAEHLDFAAIGLPQQGGNLLGEVGAVVHHRQQYAVDLELGLICRFTLFTVWSSCSRPLAAGTPPERGL